MTSQPSSASHELLALFQPEEGDLVEDGGGIDQPRRERRVHGKQVIVSPFVSVISAARGSSTIPPR